MYETEDTDIINSELVADLVGDYIFTDESFVRKLSAEDKNIFQRIFDEIKYLCNAATAGSKEARQLEKVKKIFEDAYRADNGQKNNTDTDGGVKYSIGNITSTDGKDYGVGVYLDSTLLENLNENERKQMVREYIKEIGGKSFTAYDGRNKVEIKIARPNQYFKNKNGKWKPVNNDLSSKYMNDVKQDAIVLVDELIDTASYENSKKSKYTHGWLDNNSKNNWDYWNTYVVDKSNTIWSVKLIIANTVNGEKVLYDIGPIKKVGSSVESDITPTDTNISQSDNNVNNIIPENLENDTNSEDLESSSNTQHSVSDKQNENHGKYYGKDIALEEETANEDIAPVKDDMFPFLDEEDTEVYKNGIMENGKTKSSDTAPIKKVKSTVNMQTEGTQGYASEYIGKILTEEMTGEKRKRMNGWNMFTNHIVDNATPFETLSLKTGNRELDAKFNRTRTAEGQAQTFIGNGDEDAGVLPLQEIFAPAKKAGLRQEFFDYLYQKHNIDRMTLTERFGASKNKAVYDDDVTADKSREIVQKNVTASQKDR